MPDNPSTHSVVEHDSGSLRERRGGGTSDLSHPLVSIPPTTSRRIVSVAALEEANRLFWAPVTHSIGPYEFRPATGEVLRDGKVVAMLTETESETLHLLVRAYPVPVPRRRLIEEMRRLGCYSHIDTVKTVVARLRRKLGTEIVATRPRGYVFGPEGWLHTTHS